MYVGLTKGQRPAFKKLLQDVGPQFFICGNLCSCFFIFRCLYEAGDVKSCFEISKCFHCDNRIAQCPWAPFNRSQISYILHSKWYQSALLPYDIENLIYFFNHQECKVWKELCLDTFHIEDRGCEMLYHGLISCAKLTIEEIDLSCNYLTSQSADSITAIIIHCKTKKLRVTNNRIGAKAFGRLLSSNSSALEELNLDNNHLSSAEAIILFKALRKCNHLKILEITSNNIGDDAVEEISASLQVNNQLKELWIDSNPITGRAALSIVQSLKMNRTLEFLWLPSYRSDKIVHKIKRNEQKINDHRKNEQFIVQIQIHLTGPYVQEDNSSHDDDGNNDNNCDDKNDDACVLY